MAITVRRHAWLSSRFLTSLLLVYSILNLVLVILSTVGWVLGRNYVNKGACYIGDVHCGFTRWGLYFFIAIAASVSHATAGFMALNCYMRPRNVIVDPVWIFRGTFFTLIPLTTVTFIGWSNLDVGSTKLYVAGAVMESLPRFRGLGGTFVLEMLDKSKFSKPAMVMLHTNLLCGALLAGYASAISPAGSISSVGYSLQTRYSKDTSPPALA